MSRRRRTSADGKLIYFAWSPGDFNAKTTHLSDDARNAYRELLDFTFLHGRNQTDLPDDDRYLRVAARVKDPAVWADVRYVLFDCPNPMFDRTGDGFWRNSRLTDEVEIAREKSNQAREARSGRGGVRDDNGRGTDVHTDVRDPLHASATIASESVSSSSGTESLSTEGEREGKPTTRTPVPDFEAVQRVAAKLDQSALLTKPSLQITTAWVTDYGEDLIVETLADCEPSYAGKHYQYLERILTGRRNNPSERPANRRSRGGGGNGRVVDGGGGAGNGTVRKRPKNYA